jgi:hypothetical protein
MNKGRFFDPNPEAHACEAGPASPKTRTSDYWLACVDLGDVGSQSYRFHTQSIPQVAAM